MTEKSLLLQQAEQAHAENRLDTAIELCQQVLVDEPNSLHASLLAGISAAKARKFDSALEYLSRCIGLDAKCFPAHVWLVYMLCDAGRAKEASPHVQRALQLQPNHPEVLYSSGLFNLATGNYPVAKTLFERALATNRTSPTFHFGLFQVHERMGDLPEALTSLRRAVKYSGDPDWTFKLGLLELAAGNVSKAREIALRTIGADPNSSEANHLMAKVLQAEHKDDEAAPYLQKSSDLDPTNEVVLQEIAVHFQTLGHFEEAIAAFRRVLELKPEQGGAYYGIASSKKITFEDRPLVEEMERIAAGGRIDSNERTMLEFALGKCYRDLEEPGKAMAHFDTANLLFARLNFHGRTFDRDGLKADIDASIKLFTPEFMATQARGSVSDTPIFIVGMVRSGTTLMEHILSCHPDVGAAGEQGFWAEQERALVDYKKETIDAWTLQANAEAYLHLVEGIAPGKPRVTDRSPANVLSLGLIHLAFPNAKIIHMIRHPVDTLLSIYMTAIKNPPPFACDKENLVFAYKQYMRAIDHWRKVLPSDRFLDVRYEDLARNPEAETSRVIEFLNLPWSEACATPEKNPRRVNTPSLWQVRQPIHQSSTKKWETYRPWLGAFAEFLDDTK